MESGIIKQWNDFKKWGIVYCPGEKRYFLHASKVTRGTPGLFRRVEFEIGPPRNPAELPMAIKAVVNDEVTDSVRTNMVRP